MKVWNLVVPSRKQRHTNPRKKSRIIITLSSTFSVEIQNKHSEDFRKFFSKLSWKTRQTGNRNPMKWNKIKTKPITPITPKKKQELGTKPREKNKKSQDITSGANWGMNPRDPSRKNWAFWRNEPLESVSFLGRGKGRKERRESKKRKLLGRKEESLSVFRYFVVIRNDCCPPEQYKTSVGVKTTKLEASSQHRAAD